MVPFRINMEKIKNILSKSGMVIWGLFYFFCYFAAKLNVAVKNEELTWK